MVSSVKSVMLRATMMLVVLCTLSAPNVVRGQNQCSSDGDCPSGKYCYESSGVCVNFTQCDLQNRLEAATPARHPSQCGPCLPGYEEVPATKILQSDALCKQKLVLQESPGNVPNVDNWTGIYIGVGILFFALIIISIITAFKMTKCPVSQVSASGRFFEKVSFLATRPTAPPQDDASYTLRRPSYVDEEQPPVYASVIRPNIDKNHLVSATPTNDTPTWIIKPPYEPDYNDNVADGAAIPIHSSSTNLQMEMEDEGATNPSSWTPGQLTVDLSTRPFALFANSEQEDNALNNVLMRGNYSSNSHEESTSDDSSEIPEETPGPRMNGGIYCGPNVQINQTITLNIAKNGTK